MDEDKFYLNFLPYTNKYLYKTHKKIEIFIYKDFIENADIIIEKNYAYDIISKVIYHSNSMSLMKKQRMSFFKRNKDMVTNFLRIYNILKRYPLEIKKNFLIFSSGVLTAYGLRRFNDVDIYIRASKIKDIEPIDGLISELKSLRMIKFDITVENTPSWKGYWTTWQKEWCQLANINNFDDIFDNYDNNFYFCGLRFTSLSVDIARRRKRNRQNAIADLIMIKKYIRPELVMWPLPEYSIIFSDRILNIHKVEHVHNMIEDDKDRYVYFRKSDKKDISRLIKNTLKKRYREKYTINEIMNLIPNKIVINKI